MIVTIDHLAFASRCAGKDLSAFQRLGYEAEFVEKDLQDLENKQPFMAHFSGRLEMALLKRSGSLNIELLDHGHAVKQGSGLHPVLEGLDHDLERVGNSFVASERSFVKVRSRTLDAEVFVLQDSHSAEFACRRVIADTHDMESSAVFWRKLGFKQIAVGEDYIQLEFRMPLGGVTCELYVRETPKNATRTLLDAHGFNCVAFFSSASEKDRQKFERLGMQPTRVNHLRVGGKDLSIYWLQGPGGEIVEVIGLT